MSAPGRLVAPLIFAALVAAAIAILVLSQNARSRLVVDQVELSNQFAPEAEERAAIRFRLTEDEERATIAVMDEDGATVEVLAAGQPLGDFEIHRFRWDGGDEPPGSYRVRLTLESLDREIVLPEEIDLVHGRDG